MSKAVDKITRTWEAIPMPIRSAIGIAAIGSATYYVWDKFIRDKADPLAIDFSNFKHKPEEVWEFGRTLYHNMRGLNLFDDYLPQWEDIAAGKYNRDELRYIHNYFVEQDDNNSLYDFVESQLPNFWNEPLQREVLMKIAEADIDPINSTWWNKTF